MGILDTLGIKLRNYKPPDAPSPEWEGSGMTASIEGTEAQGALDTPNAKVKDPYSTYSPKELSDFVEKEFDRRSKERVPFELQWKLNIAFMENNQYVDINHSAQTIQATIPDYAWEEREVFNHIAPNVEARQARLGKMRPVLKARAGSSEKSDIRATKVSSHLLTSIQHDQKVRDKIHEVIKWIEATGTCFFKNTWNPEMGLEIPKINQETGEPELDPQTGMPIMVREGDLEISVVPAPEFYPDTPFVQKMYGVRSAIHARIIPVSVIEDTWGIKVSPEETKAIRLQELMTGGGFIGQNYSRGMSQSLKESAIVKEYYERPTKKYPQGRFITVCGGKLLQFGPLPYKCDKDGKLGLPFVKVCCIERPGIFWGRTIIERLIPIQRRYNALRNRKAEYLAACSIGGWVVEENSVDLNDLQNNGGQPGYVCVYKTGMTAPRRTENAPLPAAFESEEQTLLTEFSISSGVSEMSRQSKAPTGVKSGVALSLALEQDETRLADTANNIEEALIEAGSQWLRLEKQFAQGTKLLRIVGKDNVVDVMDWTASDLKPEDVIMDSFSALSESPAQKRQMVFDLLGMGLFNNPDTGAIDRPTRTRILEMLQFLDWEGANDDDQAHIAKAERENRQLAQGAMLIPTDYDFHILHVKRHNEYRVTTEYEAIVNQYPQIDEMFTQHVAIHMQYLSQMFEAAPVEEEAQTKEE